MSTAIQKMGYTLPQLQTIRSTVAADTNDTEFNLFMEAARAYGLDPFRKQIHAIVYSKDKPDKRKMSIIVSRDGLRVMASRCGDYRPASEPAEVLTDDTLKSPTNPQGIVMARVRLWKQDQRGLAGEWFPVMGEAWWDEFAPLREIWAPDPEQQGRRAPTGKFELDQGNWTKMPRLMITKCAESQALRAGWPETFGGVYSEDEMHSVEVAATASDAIHEYERKEREARIGGPGLLMVFDDTGKLTKVPMGQVYDRCLEFVNSADPEEAHKFRVRNEDALREFWAHDKSAALDLRDAISKREDQMKVGDGA